MPGRFAKFLLVLSTAIAALPAVACECLWQGPFVDVAPKADLIVSGNVVAQKGNSFDVEIDEVLQGKEFRPNIRIWGETGHLCRADASEFPVDSRWVLALQRIDQIPEDGFNPNTPNISYGRENDYALSRCGVYWLSRDGDVVSGNIVQSDRWQYRSEDQPALLYDLLSRFLRGETERTTLEKALTENNRKRDIRELMNQTQDFLRTQ